MFSLNNKISLRQLQILIVLEIFGTGVIVLPRTVSEFAGQDGWIAIAVGVLIAILYSFVIMSIAKLFPNDSFLEYTSKIITKPLAYIVCFGFVFKIIVGTSMGLRYFGEIIKETVLTYTPYYIVFLAMIIICSYAASKGIETIARMAEVLIFLMLIPLIIIVLLVALKVDFSNLLPVMVTPPKQIFWGSFYTSMSFTGIEFCLLIVPYLSKPANARKAVLQSVLFIGGLMLIVTTVTIAAFGPRDLSFQSWPVIAMMDLVDFPGSFLERQDALMMCFYITSEFFILTINLFFGSILLKDLFKKGKHFHYVIALVLIIFAFSYVPRNIIDVYNIIEILFMTFGISYMFLLPIFLLVIAKFRRVR